MYYAMYKCRLCGEEFIDCKVEESGFAKSQAHEIAVDKNLSHTSSSGIGLFLSHRCEDGGFGIADFQGFGKVKNK